MNYVEFYEIAIKFVFNENRDINKCYNYVSDETRDPKRTHMTRKSNQDLTIYDENIYNQVS